MGISSISIWNVLDAIQREHLELEVEEFCGIL
jgi:hypothetical protein